MVVPRAASAPDRRRWPDSRLACWMPAAAPAGCLRSYFWCVLTCAGRSRVAESAAAAPRQSGAPVVRGSVDALPFAGMLRRRDAADLLCHAAVEPATALAELRRVLRPGGRLIVNMPAYSWLFSAHDRRVHNARRAPLGSSRH